MKAQKRVYLCAVMDIVLIGSGGVAESLTYSLAQAHTPPYAIVSPTEGHAERLCRLYAPEAVALHSLAEVPREASIYLFAVSDDVVARCAQEMPLTSGVWLHTAACVPLETLTECHEDSGVFYLLNTFSRGRPLALEGTPLFEEYATEQAHGAIGELALLLGVSPQPSTLALRREIHLAAVFACNFVNHQWAIASELLAHYNISPAVLHPLIQETTQKALTLNPREAQTGPARRGDEVTLEGHRKLLADAPSVVRLLYDITSQSIHTMYHSNESEDE
ncbi:MAG: DUF2520 domain-containing protein [Bacteroidales bacterium]|nr:DUF2520 domain-containing protein [Porphyromonas sp.]MDD6934587.1 DUF2520 domain-containing protein [Bacteroidales bacterium]MDY3101855.1 DUF2520 domain-containing protein [Porphyromonas sp.]